jgi:acetyl esterase/lipase
MRPAVLVAHGGAWQFGDKRRMTTVSRQLARAGFAVFNANYTLAEEERPGFPRQVRDLKAAIRWIRAHAGRLRVDPRRIGALGSSAGGHLVGLLATDSNQPLGTGTRVRAAVTWSAPFALDELRPGGALARAARVFAGCPARQCENRLAAASPVGRVSERDPAMLMVNSSQELVPVSQARAMAARLEEAGVPHRLTVVDGSRHGMELAGEMTERAVAFLREHLRRDPPGASAR